MYDTIVVPEPTIQTRDLCSPYFQQIVRITTKHPREYLSDWVIRVIEKEEAYITILQQS